MNQWLTPIVDTYIQHFGVAERPVVWEVGSRDGDDAVELGERIGDSIEYTAVAFEPNPAQANEIRRRHPQVRVIQLAASDRSGPADFMAYKGDEGAVGSSSLNLRWKEDDLEGTIIKVQMVRLDTIISNEIIDIMKIDVEGYSLQVLKGLGDKLSQVRVMHIETEDWTKSDIKVKNFMTKRGWVLTDERQEWSGMPDLTFVNTKAPYFS